MWATSFSDKLRDRTLNQLKNQYTSMLYHKSGDMRFILYRQLVRMRRQIDEV